MKTERVEAGYLPGLLPSDVQWHTLVFEDADTRLEVAVPRLNAAQMKALAERVRHASRTHLRGMSVSQIAAVIDTAVARLLDRNDPLRQQAERLLPIVSGYDAEMVRLGLQSLLKTFRAPQLHRFVAEDFANPKLLDEFQPTPKGGAVRAFGPDLLLHSWAGNVPALALWSWACGLLVKAGNIGKLPSAEPLFAGWFARLLVEIHPAWADCFAVVWWPGAGDDDADALQAQADTVIAYGGNASLDALRRRLPLSTRFLPHGHKLGVGLVSRHALDALHGPELARRAAWDVARYDQQGCYSPHLFYVERAGRITPQDFARHLAGELANLEHRFPRRTLGLDDAMAVAQWRQAAEWRAAGDAAATTITGDLLLADADARWGVAFSDRQDDLQPAALQRHVQVVAVDTLDDAIARLAPHRAILQTAGIAASPDELFRLSGRLGAIGMSRISALGAMGAPQAGWHHDGRFSLLDLVHLVEIEPGAEADADRFADYAD